MNVLLVSQCTKNALTETRRILDQFAERRGERTWQTAITQQGLDTLRRLLRKSARKNTAVACHWIHGKDHSELLWVVGDTRQFNERGATPTNATQRDILRSKDENDWHSAELIRLLAGIAALFHDFGKANAYFQKKLTASSRSPLADPYRHEWISLRLFAAFVNGADDADWLARLTSLPADASQDCLARLVRDGIGDQRIFSPFAQLRGAAQIVGWLIVSHHRLPTPIAPFNAVNFARLPAHIETEWCSPRAEANATERTANWSFKHGLPFDSRHWRKHAARLADALRQRISRQVLSDSSSPYLLHLSRMTLMLADHYYSSEPSHARYGDEVVKNKTLYANTDHDTGALKQRLDEHLIGVEVNVARLVRTLPRLSEQLPRLVHRAFRQRSSGLFAWQNRASELAEGLRTRSATQGFFGINMASTGCGKTLANGRILYALSAPGRGTRFTVALGLRTLTLQTGEAYRARLRLGDDEMAVMVGGQAVRELHEHRREIEASATGSASTDALLPDDIPVVFEGTLADGPLNRWLRKSPAAQKLLNAPMLVCTIDHLMPACESTRGGQQIPSMLRLMSSDLIIDEPDDFDLADLPALSRLVHWAAMLGSRVLLSSATLPPALIEGLFAAYRAGRAEFQKHRGPPGQPLDICCAWFDEFDAQHSAHTDVDSYRNSHRTFVDQRIARLKKAAIRRRAEILPLNIPRGERAIVCAELAAALRPAITQLHTHNRQRDPVSGKQLSFGLIRLANIDPLILLARALTAQGAAAGQHIHLCVYHSRHPLLVRSGIEQQLDRLLQRQQPETVFADACLRKCLDEHPEREHLFIVLATAVAEVGRDHDYDWAIVEPSSMRSIIQIAGRVRRHRPEPYNASNMLLLDCNIRHLEHGASQPAFLRPGFEDDSSPHFQLRSHHLSDLLSPEQLARIDASSRIRERPTLVAQANLADLEHARLRQLMQGVGSPGKPLDIPVPNWWQTPIHLTGHLQKKQRFRNNPRGRQSYVLLPDDDEADARFHRIEENGTTTDVGNLCHRTRTPEGPGVSFWGTPDYLSAARCLAEEMGISVGECARRYGTLDLPLKSRDGKQETPEDWEYCHELGFGRRR